MTQNILIIGATSGIAEALARRYASQGAQLFLVARNSDKLQTLQSDLSARGAKAVNTWILDANNYGEHPNLIRDAWQSLGRIDVALVAHGTLPDQARAETDLDYAVHEFRTNGESVIMVLGALANRFAEQGSGVIAVIGSVAGDRGRGSNYLYGSAKAAIHAYASGLRARMFKVGVHVLTIKPGFVATPMTAELNLPARLTATPEAVAAQIKAAIRNRKNVVYTPGFWAVIMLIIRHIPNGIFKRLKL